MKKLEVTKKNTRASNQKATVEISETHDEKKDKKATKNRRFLRAMIVHLLKGNNI